MIFLVNYIPIQPYHVARSLRSALVYALKISYKFGTWTYASPNQLI